MESFALSHVGKKRERNEDSYLADEATGLFVVCDGMGGHKGGDVASRLAVQTLQEYFQRCAAETTRIPEAIMDAVQLAHRRVLAAGREDENLAAMGTTLTAVLIRKNTLTAAHIGDSALYLFRQQNIVKLTQDHTLAEKMLAEGTVDAADAICNAYRHVLTRALGIDMALQADMLQERLFAGDVLLICSDGLTGMVTEEAIRQALVEHPDLPDAATALIDSALEHGGLDNVTVVLVKIE